MRTERSIPARARPREPWRAGVVPSPVMGTVPLDEGPADRRRVGIFWIEEGTGLVLFGAVLLAVVLALYTVAVLHRPR
jgi:hypothetical protein